MAKKIVLASASLQRKKMLEAAGIAVVAEAAPVDERAIESALGGEAEDGEIVASVLARAKAETVSSRYPDALVIGCDQTLSFENEIFHKPANLEEARRNLLRLSGRTHNLNSGMAIVENGETTWRHVAVATLAMRSFDAAYIGRYLARAGDAVLGGVGAYQIEGEGINLFERIDGDYFTIVGLPLLPLLEELRGRGAIDG